MNAKRLLSFIASAFTFAATYLLLSYLFGDTEGNPAHTLNSATILKAVILGAAFSALRYCWARFTDQRAA